MLASIKSLFQVKTVDAADDAAGAARRLELAGAALLFEVLKADHDFDERELASIAEVMRARGGEPEEIDELVELARRQSNESTSLYEFTSLINEHCDYREKCALVRNMWRIAWADAELSKYEDHLIRKVCELIYVSHSDFIRAKLAEKKHA